MRVKREIILIRNVFLNIIFIWVGLLCTANSYAETSEDSSKLAKKHFSRGIAAVEMAKNPDDFQDAISEFKKAIEYDPAMTEARYNLAIAQESSGSYNDALQNLKTLLKTASSDAEVEEIEFMINKVEYKIERADAAVEAQSTSQPVAAAEDSQPSAIKKISARVDYLKFYDDKQVDLPYEQTTYSKYFKKSETTFVHGELGLSHPQPWSKIDFEFEVVFIKPDGSVLSAYTSRSYIEGNWKTSHHSFARGWHTPGSWDTGSYSVEIYSDGNLIAMEEFQIY